MSKIEGQLEAIRRAKEKLAGIDLAVRCKAIGLPSPQADGISFWAFGLDLQLDNNFDLFDKATGKPVKAGDHILALHYLCCETRIQPGGEYITFRDLPGGQFYWEPFLSRSINPLLSRIGNNIELLKTRLGRFDFAPAEMGDFAAKIHCIGRLDLTLVYHLGDDEFGPAAEALFDACIKKVYCAEDAAFLASRICIGLL